MVFRAPPFLVKPADRKCLVFYNFHVKIVNRVETNSAPLFDIFLLKIVSCVFYSFCFLPKRQNIFGVVCVNGFKREMKRSLGRFNAFFPFFALSLSSRNGRPTRRGTCFHRTSSS